MTEERKIGTIGGIEVFRCMCGKHTCPYCGKEAPTHDRTHCPHCGYPLDGSKPFVSAENRIADCGCDCTVCLGGWHIFCNRRPHGTEEEAERYFVEHPEVARQVRPLSDAGQRVLDRALKKLDESK